MHSPRHETTSTPTNESLTWEEILKRTFAISNVIEKVKLGVKGINRAIQVGPAEGDRNISDELRETNISRFDAVFEELIQDGALASGTGLEIQELEGYQRTDDHGITTRNALYKLSKGGDPKLGIIITGSANLEAKQLSRQALMYPLFLFERERELLKAAKEEADQHGAERSVA